MRAAGSWGRWVHRRRWWVLGASALVLLGAFAVLLGGADLHDSDKFDFESGVGLKLETDQLPQTGGFVAGFVVTDPEATARNSDGSDNPQFAALVQQAFAQVATNTAHVKSVVSYFTAPAAAKPQLISNDGHSVVTELILVGTFDEERSSFGTLRAQVQAPAPLQVRAYGDIAISHDFDVFLAQDLQRAELVSIPLSMLLLLLVFRSLAAALVSLAVGGLAVVTGVAGMFVLAHLMAVSPYAENIVTLIGLGVAIDYSLFIVSRFREELAAGGSVEDAVGVATATAGRAIAFSGITVAIGLLSLLFFHGTFLVSMGLSGSIVVAIAVLFALTFLPALLSVLGPRVNAGRLRRERRADRTGAWHALATWVMRRPLTVLLPCLAVLLLLGSPFPSIHLVNGGVDQLPEAAESRQATELLTTQFSGGNQSTSDVVVRFNGSPLTHEHQAQLHDLSTRLQQLDVGTVESITSASVGQDIAVIKVHSKYPWDSDIAHTLVQRIRANDTVPGAQVYVTGDTAFDIDFVGFMVSTTPLAVSFVMLSTMVVLFLLLGSLVLPLKAVVMNLLSLSASFGAMVWIFQQGHLSGLLGFAAAPIDPTIPILLFCIVFGLSMDYEVFLLSRMQESWRATHDNRHAVAEGLERSGRLVSGAAAIMFVVFMSFGLAQVLLIKAIGTGMAIAVFVDATIVRALVVPAVMRLMGRVNWWAPSWMERLRRRVHVAELEPAATGTDAAA